jgi:hypothetical protein
MLKHRLRRRPSVVAARPAARIAAPLPAGRIDAAHRRHCSCAGRARAALPHPVAERRRRAGAVWRSAETAGNERCTSSTVQSGLALREPVPAAARRSPPGGCRRRRDPIKAQRRAQLRVVLDPHGEASGAAHRCFAARLTARARRCRPLPPAAGRFAQNPGRPSPEQSEIHTRVSIAACMSASSLQIESTPAHPLKPTEDHVSWLKPLRNYQ